MCSKLPFGCLTTLPLIEEVEMPFGSIDKFEFIELHASTEEAIIDYLNDAYSEDGVTFELSRNDGETLVEFVRVRKGRNKTYRIEGADKVRPFHNKHWDHVATVRAASKEKAIEVFKRALHRPGPLVKYIGTDANAYRDYRAEIEN